MKTKSSHLFWGFMFLTVGVFYLLDKLNWDFLYLDLSWDIWPVLLILIGISLITTGKIIKPVVSSLLGILIGIIIFGMFNGFLHEDDSDWYENSSSRDIQIDYSQNIKYANLTINGGVGKIDLAESEKFLVSGNIEGMINNYSIDNHTEDSTAWINIKTGIHKFKLFKKRRKNEMNLYLSKFPVWNCEFNMGATKADLDFSHLKVKNIVIKTGAAKINMKLGDTVDRCYVNAKMGAAKFELSFPETVGCKVISNTFIVKKKLPGFTETSDNVYVTDNYEASAKKIIVDLSAGVSEFRINRY